MKQIKYFPIALLAVATLTTGCKDSFLEVESPTQDFINTTRSSGPTGEDSILPSTS